ncbi:elongation factor P [Finegoldia magna]|uniref:Elongation factor P n=3 Tax=Finegoldia magna TaxID=1260 RepID=EFP_FINM2|nr:elongation factor P [Finegoldia magna]B0S053.1 RecName: Full=Elongation factor P; Short=EF-P [Finegoldia magna ATCC 29328]MDU2829035.1 elongation factor P [Anaerococcus sp.]EFK93334.1 translation elongation factor P [Finegoldia magna ACS-171-V-Col3]EFL53732.1 translation elongation factor P [Finegoldia magna BVS033A4]EGS33998.1 translation elongation factor P [Finegoldia magna SY403409CC001050417]EXF27170.1 Elongation factor P [Finegoldia magna ALB8]
MIQAGDFRKGTTFEMDGDVWQIIDFQHVKPGKGAAFVRTKIRSVMTGSNRDMTFNPNEKYEEARIETREMQYLYNDGTLYYFMDPDSYEQLPIDKASVEEAILYIKENDMATIKFFKGKAFQVSPPNFVELEITQTEPGIKGNTATGATKPATVETGATVNVPLFVNEGDKIKIDTRTGEYLSRV